MVSHYSDDGDVNNFDSSDKTSYDEFQDAFNDFLDKCLKLSRLCTKLNKIISSLEWLPFLQALSYVKLHPL